MKKLLPVWLKKPFWYLYKSYQRRLGLCFSWWVEARGLFYFLFHSYNNLKPISICTGLLNRTDNYLDYVLESVLKMERQELIELSIFDCGSLDLERLEKIIREKWTGKLVIKSEPVSFSRALSFNKAIEQATSNLVFACDADMSLPINLVKQCNRFVSRKSVWFPICFYLEKDKPPIINKENGDWHWVGKGMFAATKQQFERIGKYDESFNTWGGEDWDLWLRFFKKGILPLRTRCRGLFHHWHISLKPILNKSE